MRSNDGRHYVRAAGQVLFRVVPLLAAITLGGSPLLALPSAFAAPLATHHGRAVARVQTAAQPRWNELSPAQQRALAPLAPEWDRMDGFRRRKWLAIGTRFAAMKPEEQERLQKRMRDWARLTPEQRRQARENYARAKRLNQTQKSTQWEKYKQLPDDQKRRLAAAASRKKHVAALPTPAAQAHNRKTLPPIKSAPERMLERSVAPGAPSASVIAPAAPIRNQGSH